MFLCEAHFLDCLVCFHPEGGVVNEKGLCCEVMEHIDTE